MNVAATGADAPSSRTPSTADSAEAPPRRRVGGLPLPGKTIAVAPAAPDAVAIGTVWNCRFPAARGGDDAHAVRRRAGGLPLPARFVPRSGEPAPRVVDAPSRHDATVRFADAERAEVAHA